MIKVKCLLGGYTFPFFFRACFDSFYDVQASFYGFFYDSHSPRTLVLPLFSSGNLERIGRYLILPLMCCLKSDPQLIQRKIAGFKDTNIVSSLQVGQIPPVTCVVSSIDFLKGSFLNMFFFSPVFSFIGNNLRCKEL